jgi:hypothetical protein
MNNNAIPTNHAPVIRSDGWVTTLQQKANEALQRTLATLAEQRHHAWSHDEMDEAFA